MGSVDSNDDEIVREAVEVIRRTDATPDVMTPREEHILRIFGRHIIDALREREVVPLRDRVEAFDRDWNHLRRLKDEAQNERDDLAALLREVRPDYDCPLRRRIEAALRGEGGQGGEDRPG